MSSCWFANPDQPQLLYPYGRLLSNDPDPENKFLHNFFLFSLFRPVICNACFEISITYFASMQIFLGIVHSLRHCSMQRHRSVHCKFDFTHIHLPEQPALQLHLISSIQALAAYGRMVQQVDIAGFSELLLLLHPSILFKPYCSGGGTTGSATKFLSPDMTCLIGCSSHMLVKTSV